MVRLFAVMLLIGFVFAPFEASARIFGRKHGYYSYTPSQQPSRLPAQPVTNADFTYPDKGDGKIRLLQTIGEHRYFVIYSVNNDGVPVAEVTHILKNGQYVALSPETEVPRTSKVIQTIPEVGTFAFLFQGRKGEIYAERISAKDVKPFWKILPEADTRGKHRRLFDMERAHALSAERARVMEKALDAQRRDPNIQRVLRQSQASAAYQRFYATLKPVLPKALPSREAIVNRAGFPATPRGTHSLIATADPKRPGVVITSDEEHYQEVDDVVADLRGATTATIIARNFLHNDRDTLERLRANSTIIAQPGKKFDEGMKRAYDETASLPAYVAAGAVVEAERRAGEGAFANASQRMERAARGGPGKSQFNHGLVAGKTEAVARAQASLSQVVDLVVERMREMAYQQAARIQAHAKDVGKKSDYVAFEIDFLNQRHRGVEYVVETRDGKSYVLRNVGKNFNDPSGDFLPARAYGRFNVTLLQRYEKNGGITKDDLYEIGMNYDLYPTQEGEIVYINPARYSEERMTAIRNGLQARYDQNRSLSFRDIQDI